MRARDILLHDLKSGVGFDEVMRIDRFAAVCGFLARDLLRTKGSASVKMGQRSAVERCEPPVTSAAKPGTESDKPGV